MANEHIQKVAQALEGAFLWEATPQGFDYWSSVYQGLMQIDENNPIAVLEDFENALYVIENYFEGDTSPSEYIEAIAEAILNGFQWVRTTEGLFYWDAVHDNLNDLAQSYVPPKLLILPEIMVAVLVA